MSKVLAIIPARGGSKGLPRKNILDLGGKPMIAWSIQAAKQSQLIERCIISTDDAEIAKVARSYNGDVPFIRPADIAHDQSTTLDVALHAIDILSDYDTVVILQPTSPLRNAKDIDDTISAMRKAGSQSAVSVCEPAKSPYWSYRTDEENRLVSLIDPKLANKRRQDLPDAYVLNGAVYVAQIDWLKENLAFVDQNTVAHIMPPERSLDIDTAFDLKLVAFYLHEAQQNQLAANA